MRSEREQQAYDEGKWGYDPTTHSDEENAITIRNARQQIAWTQEHLATFTLDEKTGKLWHPSGKWCYTSEEAPRLYIARYEGQLSRFD